MRYVILSIKRLLYCIVLLICVLLHKLQNINCFASVQPLRNFRGKETGVFLQRKLRSDSEAFFAFIKCWQVTYTIE